MKGRFNMRTRYTCGFLISAMLVGTAGAAPADNTRATLQGSMPSWATNRNLAGSADPATAVGFRVYLGWTDPAGAVALAKAVSDPGNSAYGHYLTANQFRARFAPAASDTAK